jgi:peptide/nickel transport system substrate-binding protein
MLDPTSPGGEESAANRQRRPGGLPRLGLTLAAVSCSGPERDASTNGVRGGTLRVLSAESGPTLDTADVFGPIARAYARTLYGYDLSGPPEQQTVPVPDIAAGPPQLSADRRTYTFTLRPGVRYAPPVDREVTATDFITAIERLYDKKSPSGGQFYANLIAGTSRFGAGKASRISGLAALDARTLQITLDQPAGDFLSNLVGQLFAPVPKEYAANYQVGANYSGHVVGTGPYTPTIYIPGETIVLDRNPNWDPATDPLRKAWVDRIQVKLDVKTSSIQQAIEREEADLSLDGHVPQPGSPPSRPTPSNPGGCRSTPAARSCSWSSEPTGGPGRSPMSGSARRSTTPSTRSPTATPSPDGSPPPASWPPPSWPRARSATSRTTCTPPLAAGATPPRPEPCSPRLATPRG